VLRRSSIRGIVSVLSGVVSVCCTSCARLAAVVCSVGWYLLARGSFVAWFGDGYSQMVPVVQLAVHVLQRFLRTVHILVVDECDALRVAIGVPKDVHVT